MNYYDLPKSRKGDKCTMGRDGVCGDFHDEDMRLLDIDLDDDEDRDADDPVFTICPRCMYESVEGGDCVPP